MPRRKGSKNLKSPIKNSTPKKICTSCNEEKILNTQFYYSNSRHHSDNRYPVCKTCILEGMNINDLNTVKPVLLEMNRPMLYTLWNNSLIEAKNKNNSHPFGIYLKSLQLSYKELTWLDSDHEVTEQENISFDNKKDNNQQEATRVVEISSNDKQNEEDVLRMLGYDPFEFESSVDRRHLFNKLVDFLDESTLEDSFKLPAVIEIVKSFNQIDKINSALSHITSDVKSVSENVGGITSLVNAKEKMLKSVLALAKDNGISVNHNNNKSKGAGTLSGIIKQLHEKGIEAAEVNVYDIDTCEGMRQVADISNKSILEQLMLNENDYVEMIKEQREMITKLQNSLDIFEEENRQLKVKIKFLEIEEKKKISIIDVENSNIE